MSGQVTDTIWHDHAGNGLFSAGEGAETCAPPSTYSQNLFENRLGLGVCAMGQYALYARELQNIYAPLIVRQ